MTVDAATLARWEAEQLAASTALIESRTPLRPYQGRTRPRKKRATPPPAVRPRTMSEYLSESAREVAALFAHRSTTTPKTETTTMPKTETLHEHFLRALGYRDTPGPSLPPHIQERLRIPSGETDLSESATDALRERLRKAVTR